MNLIPQWLTDCFPKRRLMPTDANIRSMQELYRLVFDNKPGRELIELWLETIVFANPRTTDPNECIAYAVKCAFIEDMIKALDKADNPAKYAQLEQAPSIGPFDARKVA